MAQHIDRKRKQDFAMHLIRWPAGTESTKPYLVLLMLLGSASAHRSCHHHPGEECSRHPARNPPECASPRAPQRQHFHHRERLPTHPKERRATHLEHRLGLVEGDDVLSSTHQWVFLLRYPRCARLQRVRRGHTVVLKRIGSILRTLHLTASKVDSMSSGPASTAWPPHAIELE